LSKIVTEDRQADFHLRITPKPFLSGTSGRIELKARRNRVLGRAENLFAKNEDSIGWPAQNSSPTRHQK
jgi:hypothetical protein